MTHQQLLELLGQPTYREWGGGEPEEWDYPGEAAEVDRDDKSLLARTLRYVLYTYRIAGKLYVFLPIASCEDGGVAGYWPLEKIHQIEDLLKMGSTYQEMLETLQGRKK